VVPKNCPEMEAKALMFQALVDLGPKATGLPLMRDGQPIRLGLWIIDAGYMPDIVKRYIEGPARALGVPTIATRGYSADKYRPTSASVIGLPREQCHLAETNITGKFLAFNACYWREVAQKAWLASPNAPGSLSLYEGGRHREFADHIVREKLIEKLHGNTGDVWKWHAGPGWHDWGDAVTMAYVGAAWNGIGTGGGVPQAKQKPRQRKGVQHVTL